MPASTNEGTRVKEYLRYAHFLKDLGFVCLESAPVVATKRKAKEDALAKVNVAITECRKCSLWQSRTHVVCGSGNPDAGLVFIGEAPGEKEDLQGEAFVGPAGALLTHYLKVIGLTRSDVFITNIIKCRPPGNRDPEAEEIQLCEPYLVEQLDIMEPAVICTLGRYAAQTLLRTSESISRMRGNIYQYHGITLLPTFHPASLLYSPKNKELFEKDFQLLRTIYDKVRAKQKR